MGRFLDPHTVEITSASGTTILVQGNYILTACGPHPGQSASILMDGKRIVDTDGLPELSDLPREIIGVTTGSGALPVQEGAPDPRQRHRLAMLKW